jgi:spoIIIJ-associated protein
MKKNRRLVPQPRRIELDYSEKWGKDVGEATKLALADLKISENEAVVTVLEQPTKGFFGIGSKLAKVRVEKKESADEGRATAEDEFAAADPGPEAPEDGADKAGIGKIRDLRKSKSGAGAAPGPRGGGPGRGPGGGRDGRPERRAGSERGGRRERERGRERGERRGRAEESRTESRAYWISSDASERRGPAGRARSRFGQAGPGGASGPARRAENEGRNADPTGPAAEGDKKFLLNERPADLRPVSEGNAAEGFFRELIEKMGLSVNVRVFENDECVYMEVDGNDSRTVIGKRGQTLDAIQYLTNLVMNKSQGKYIRVIIDVEGYRSRREKTLEQLAVKLAKKVERTGRNVHLEPMNPYERKVIHATLQSNGNISTRSEGEEPYRRVIIERK